VDSGNDEQFPTSQSQFLESAIKKKLKVIKKFNFPSKNYSLISWPAQAKRKIQAS
jgi:hypothetical protein